MMDGVITYKDCPGMVREERKPRQIKTREKSFKSIKSAWNNFLLTFYNGALDHMKDKIATDKFTTTSEGKLTSKAERKLDKRAETIAKIEEKIKILSLEEVPKNYVSERKIKLKKNMMANMRYNCGYTHTIGYDRVDNVFAASDTEDFSRDDEKVESAISETTETFKKFFGKDHENSEKSTPVEEHISSDDYGLPEVVAEEEEKPIRVDDIQVVPTEVERNNLKKTVDDKFAEVTVEEEKTVSPEEVRKAVDGVFDSVDMKNSAPVISAEEVAEAVNRAMDEVSLDSEEDTISREEIDESVDSKLDEVAVDEPITREEVAESVDSKLDEVAVEEPITREEIAESVDSKMDEVAVDESKSADVEEIAKAIDDVMGNVKASRNNTSPAKINKYDSDGRRKTPRFTYTPMSDEEIAAARENIEYDKYEKIYGERVKKPAITIPEVSFDKIFTPAKNRSIDNNDRVMPVVVEDKNDVDEIDEYTFSTESDEGLSFDYSDATPNDLLNASQSLQTTTDFRKLKEEVEKLKQRQLITKNRVAAAEQAQLEAAKKAQEAKRKKAESKKAYDEMVSNLVKYSEALREDCQFNENKAKIADADRECNERFIKSQEEEANGYMELVNEMNDLIAPRATNVRRR